LCNDLCTGLGVSVIDLLLPIFGKFSVLLYVQFYESKKIQKKNYVFFVPDIMSDYAKELRRYNLMVPKKNSTYGQHNYWDFQIHMAVIKHGLVH
jgi:hypothetical protein